MLEAALDAKNPIHIQLDEVKTILDVGTTSDESLSSSNIILKGLCAGKEVTAFTDQNLDKSKFVSTQIGSAITGDITGSALNIGKYDLVTCTAVLEHCGSDAKQMLALSNLMNVAERWLFLTIPNRYYPIELHSKLPLIHWLPKALYRKIYATIGYEELSLEKNLNYISPRKVLNALNACNPDAKFRVIKIYTFGFCSNYVFIIQLR